MDLEYFRTNFLIKTKKGERFSSPMQAMGFPNRNDFMTKLEKDMTAIDFYTLVTNKTNGWKNV